MLELEELAKNLVVCIDGLYVVRTRKGRLDDEVGMLDALKKVFAIFESHNLSIVEALAFLEAVKRNTLLFSRARLLPEDMEDLLR